MADRVKEWPKTPRLTRYPWHEWMDGSLWRLEHGLDFDGSFKNMRATIATHAKRHNIAVKTKVERDLAKTGSPERWLYVRFYPGQAYGATLPEDSS